MFSFVIRYLGFLKSIPLVAMVFDSLLRLIIFATKPHILSYIDDIEAEVSNWQNIKTTIHKYGGLQFNYGNVELGHIHSNGLLDMLLNRQIKEQLMQDGHIQDHHVFENSGWISFFIRTEADKFYAVQLLELAYQRKSNPMNPIQQGLAA